MKNNYLLLSLFAAFLFTCTTTFAQTLEVSRGSSGATANVNSLGIFETNGPGNFLSLLAPAGTPRGMIFDDEFGGLGAIIYDSDNVADGLDFRTNNNTSKMVIDGNGNVGIGTTAPDAKLDVQGLIDCEVSANTLSIPNNFFDVDINGSSVSTFGGLTVRYSDFPDGGYGLYARTTGGVNVGNVDGIAFAPVNASAFNVSSDRRLKKEIKSVDTENASIYMDYLRNIESASFWYKSEKTSERPVPHIGVIAQSLPKELQVEISEKSSEPGNERLGVSLADWLGLVTIGVKENDQRLIQLEQQQEEIEALRNKNEDLEARLAKIEALLKQSAINNPTISNSTTVLTDAKLEQNQPNPFNGSTVVRYFIPQDVKRAELRVTDLTGKVIKSIAIQARGEGQTTFDATTLGSGNYQYSLFLDGQLLDTKQMVLTKN